MRNIDRTNINLGGSLSSEDWALENILRKTLQDNHILDEGGCRKKQRYISENVELYHAWKEYCEAEAGKYVFPQTVKRWEAEKILSEYAERILAMDEGTCRGTTGIWADIKLVNGIQKRVFVEDDGTVIFN